MDPWTASIPTHMPESKSASSARKGKAVEQLVAAVCVLATAGELNALTALVDDGDVDFGLQSCRHARLDRLVLR